MSRKKTFIKIRMSSENNLCEKKEELKRLRSLRKKKMITIRKKERFYEGDTRAFIFILLKVIPVMRQLLAMQVTGPSRFFRNIFK